MNFLTEWALFLFSFILLRTNPVSSFNIEPRAQFVKDAPDSGSYFGFSVALHKIQENARNAIDNNWILVGAPLAQNLQPGTNHSGALFKCPLTARKDDCIQVKTDGMRSEAEDDYVAEEIDPNVLRGPLNDEIKDGQWLGVSVRSQRPGGYIVVCAHRYIKSPNLKKHHYGRGLCYQLSSKFDIKETLEPCNGRPVEKLHQQFGYCQAGISVAIFNDGMSFLGSPGPYTWRGTIFGMALEGDFLERDNNIYHSILNDDPKPIDKYSYLGMSVGGGHFDQKSRMLYVSGAPRGDLFGKVYFFELTPKKEELDIVYILNGDQFGSSFGYELLVTDINNDGFDDLLVGAPFYYNQTEKSGGAVYVYMNVQKCLSQNLEYCSNFTLKGKSMSRFGFSMTSLGDINKDGYNDVAIGAPYHNKDGAVFIYLGTPKGLVYSQTLAREGIKTMGYALSGGIDMDENGYPDLAVGAYDSDKVILFQTRPIIDININVSGTELRNINATISGCKDFRSHNNTCFSFKSCFEISNKIKDSKLGNGFAVIYNLTELKRTVSRVWIHDNAFPDKTNSFKQGRIWIKDTSQPYCERFTAFIKREIKDILNPIKFKIQYVLDEKSSQSRSDPLLKNIYPILNISSTKTFEATFKKNCGNDDICTSNIIVSAAADLERGTEDEMKLFPNIDTYLIKNISKEVIVNTTVRNKLDPAYEAKLFVIHSPTLSYINLQNTTENVRCSYVNDTMVACDLGNPFGKKKITISMRFEVVRNADEPILKMNFFVNSTSKEISNKTSYQLVLIQQKFASFQLTGKSTSKFTYGGEIKGESAMKVIDDIGPPVLHDFHLENNGDWPLTQVKVVIWYPYQIWQPDERAPGKWILYMEEMPKITADTSCEKCYCEISNSSVINQLKLQYDGNQELANLEEPSLGRRRRRQAIDFKVKPSKLRDGDKEKDVIVLECGENSAKCAIINCFIPKLDFKDAINIKIHSRIWNSTLTEDYSGVDWVSIRTGAKVILDPLIKISNSSVSEALVETVAYPKIPPQSFEVVWWHYAIAIILGLILLVIIAFVLWKCGFFKRNKPPEKATVQKSGEEQPLNSS